MRSVQVFASMQLALSHWHALQPRHKLMRSGLYGNASQQRKPPHPQTMSRAQIMSRIQIMFRIACASFVPHTQLPPADQPTLQ